MERINNKKKPLSNKNLSCNNRFGWKKNKEKDHEDADDDNDDDADVDDDDDDGRVGERWWTKAVDASIASQRWETIASTKQQQQQQQPQKPPKNDLKLTWKSPGNHLVLTCRITSWWPSILVVFLENNNNSNNNNNNNNFCWVCFCLHQVVHEVSLQWLNRRTADGFFFPTVFNKPADSLVASLSLSLSFFFGRNEINKQTKGETRARFTFPIYEPFNEPVERRVRKSENKRIERSSFSVYIFF